MAVPALGLIASLGLPGCSDDAMAPGVPDCRALSASVDFGLVVRPQGGLPNITLDVPVSVRSVLTVRTTAGQETLYGSISYRITSSHAVAPAFRIPEAEGDPDFELEPEETLTFTLEATVGESVTPGIHTGVVDFGEGCGETTFRIEVVGWDEAPPVFVTMWGLEGEGPGRFDSPTGVAVDSRGRVFILDYGNNWIQVFDAEGRFLYGFRTLDERPLFHDITGIAIDENDQLYVADYGFEGFPRISVFDAEGDRQEVWDRVARFPYAAAPGRLAVRSREAFLVDPAAGNIVHLRHRTDDALEVVTRIGKTGPGDEEFGEPRGVAIDNRGHVYVTDVEKHAVFVFREDGEFLYRFGQPGSIPGRFNKPAGIHYADDGHLYVVDELNVRVQKFTPEGRFVSLWGHPGYLEGAFYHPLEVAEGPDGSFFVIEEGHHRVQQFRYESQVP